MLLPTLVIGFIFGKWLGTLMLVFGNTLGGLLLYLLAKTFFSDLIEKKFATRFSKESDSFFVGTMLPIADNLRLQIRLGQIPRLWNTDVEEESKFNPEMRNWCLVSSGSDNFIRSLYSLIPMNIPLIYLEGYKKLESKIDVK